MHRISALTRPPCSPRPAPAGSGRTSPAAPLAAANPALVTRRPGSDTGSPLGRYGAVGSPSSQGAASSGIGAAAEEALAARMGGLTTRDLAVPTSSATSVQVRARWLLPRVCAVLLVVFLGVGRAAAQQWIAGRSLALVKWAPLCCTALLPRHSPAPSPNPHPLCPAGG